MYGLLFWRIYALPILRALEAIIDLKTFSLLSSKLDHSAPMALTEDTSYLTLLSTLVIHLHTQHDVHM